MKLLKTNQQSAGERRKDDRRSSEQMMGFGTPSTTATAAVTTRYEFRHIGVTEFLMMSTINCILKWRRRRGRTMTRQQTTLSIMVYHDRLGVAEELSSAQRIGPGTG